jgi:hypothetical protein
VTATKATQQSQKPWKKFSYAYHSCSLNGHKMTYCPKFTKMQKMFHGKFVTLVEVQPIVEIKIIIANVNVVDVNVTIISKTIEEHVFKDRKPRKTKNVVGWEKEEWLKKSMVEIIQQI